MIKLIPAFGASFIGTESLSRWKNTMSGLLYPVTIGLAGPMLPLLNLPDPPPPFLVIGFAIYWTILALDIYYQIGWIKGLNHQQF